MVAVVTDKTVRMYRVDTDAVGVYDKYVALDIPVLMIADNVDIICPVNLLPVDFAKLINTYQIHMSAIEKGISNIVSDFKRR